MLQAGLNATDFLHLAMQQNDASCLKTLFNFKCDYRILNKESETLLIAGLKNRRYETVSLLLRLIGKDKEFLLAKDKDGKDALDLSMEFGSISIQKSLSKLINRKK